MVLCKHGGEYKEAAAGGTSQLSSCQWETRGAHFHGHCTFNLYYLTCGVLGAPSNFTPEASPSSGIPSAFRPVFIPLFLGNIAFENNPSVSILNYVV